MKTRHMYAAAWGALGILFATQVFAQTPPPGFIYDVGASNPGPTPTQYTLYSTSFTADQSTTLVSFAFREAPAYWGFDDVSVVANGGSTNLLTNPGFESSGGAVATNFPGGGWGRWIQAIDTSAIGEVASNTQPYGCNQGARTGTLFWCDGSVQGYDALYQSVPTIAGHTYTASFYLQDDSGSSFFDTANDPTDPSIDVLVYAGDTLPVGSIPIGVPEPATWALFGLGALAALFMRRRRPLG